MWYTILMSFKKVNSGFTLIEVLVAIGIFLLFALGVYGGVQMIFKVVYMSRTRILETALISEELEVARNLPYDQVGILNGVPTGLLSHTKTVTRNGQSFDLVTTVRNIDDTFDGMATGTPTRDTAPADYKLVEISAICSSCIQKEPVILSTIVAPKGLEGASQNGHLFIQVFDADGQAVPTANVSVNAVVRTSTIAINDVTDNDGWLRIVDTPTGTLAYNISVTKFGYSSDYTVASTVQNPNPLVPPANVVSQMVTEISFSIDRLANLTLHTISNVCAAIGGVGFNLYGDKKLGKNPDVYKYSHNFITDGSGNYVVGSLEWDNYHLSTSGTAYDVAGSIPMLSLNITPGLTQDVSLILRAHTANSLLVKVVDAGTGLPLSDATVRLFGTGFDETIATGLGYVRQTDWSSGSGQILFTNETKYFSDSGSLDTNSPSGDIKLKKVGQYYLNSGWLESSTFDLGTTVDFHNIIWMPLSQPTSTGADAVLMQIATSNSSSPAIWNFNGPDGTAATFYTATSTLIHSNNNGNQYLRYKLFLSTADTHATPQFSEVAFTYTNNCIPPGQVFFPGLSAGTFTIEVNRSGYAPNSGSVEISGNNEATVNLSTSD